MCSDDTEHMCLTAQAVIASGGDEARFTKELAKRLRWWLIGLPAGTGMATLKACVRLWMGISPESSGVFSAGNGPAMRAPILGVALADDLRQMQKLMDRSTLLTHTDPKAQHGAVLAGFAAAWSVKGDFNVGWPGRFREFYRAQRIAADAELDALLSKVLASVARGESADQFMDSQGITYGVTGYMYHTIPAVLHVWFRHPLDYRRAIEEMVRAGGDADTTGAILGGIIGASVGKEGIPAEWRSSIWEWPRSLAWMEQLAKPLAESRQTKRADAAVPCFWPGLILRNVFFALVVVFHGFRRMLPPYI
jgi:ADP-ribosylglycohydrolase